MHYQFMVIFAVILFALSTAAARSGEPPLMQIGIGVRDITPETPIRLAGYAGRNKPADKVDQPLLVQAVAWKDQAGEPLVMVSLDNCEVARDFTEPVLKEVAEKYGTKPGSVMIVSSHTHSAPILDGTLDTMYQLPAEDWERIRAYSRKLQAQIVGVVGDALGNFQPARLEHGIGRATFAMNRRVYRDDRVIFGDNPDGPVDWDVPVLRIKGTNDAVRAILFGYACHGTSVRTGDDFYMVSGEYMAYARQYLESLHPGAVAVYLTGIGADADPAPRGRLVEARRHGLELAGAVMGVLDRPMRTVRGPLKLAYEEVELPLVGPPGKEQLQKDAQNTDVHVRKRAEKFLTLLAQGKPLPASVKLPLAAVRIGGDLTFLAMGGEPVVDYGIRFKRLFAADHPWLIGYAYEVPCYIPSVRIIKEGGYEADSSLLYYGLYGPFRGLSEDKIIKSMSGLVATLRQP